MRVSECGNCYGTGRDYKKRTPGVYGFKIPRCVACKGKGFIGETISTGTVTPAMLKNLGFPKDKAPSSLTLNEAFVEYDKLLKVHNGREIPPSAVGVYTYFESKLGIGLKQLLAGARKFNLDLLDRHDIAYITQRAKDVCDKWDLHVESQESLDFELVKNEIYSGNYH